MGKDTTWSSNVEFVFSLLSYCVGLGNIWRFPYLCMRNGGGAFLLPYLTSLLLCAMPLFVLEVSAAQFSGFGSMDIWNLCPLFRGIGFATFLLIFLSSVFYILIIVWVLYYLIRSCAAILPWSTCHNAWNSPSCWIHQNTGNLINQTSSFNATSLEKYHTGDNLTTFNISAEHLDWPQTNKPWTSPADEFWHNEVLDLSPGVTDLGGMKWDLLGCLVLAWIVVFLCISKGTQSLGKIVYVTTPLPYILLSILLVRGMLLPGSMEGIKYYIIPDWSRLLEFQVWTEASLQTFYSIGPAWGSLITMASYNKFHSNCIRDAVCVSLMGAGTSFFAGFVIFSVIGFMSFKSGLSVEEIVSSGPGLTFIAYPEAIARMPLSPLWAILFFTMLTIVGINSQMFFVETVVNCWLSIFPKLFKTKRVLCVALVCVLCFLMGLIMCTRGGFYIFLVIDWYIGSFTVILIGLLECTIIFYIYGHERFYSDIELMLGHKPLVWWRICWGYICPVILLIMTVYNLCALGEPYYREYTYPRWAIGIGWVVATFTFVPIPVVMLKSVLEQKGPLIQRIKTQLQPSSRWGPSVPELSASYKYQSTGFCPGLPFCKTSDPAVLDEKETIGLTLPA